MVDKKPLDALKNDTLIRRTLNSVDKVDRASLRQMYVEIYTTLLKQSFDKLFEYKKKTINKRFEASRPKYPFQRPDAKELTDERYLELSDAAEKEYAKWDEKVKTKDEQIKIARKQAISRAEVDTIQAIHEIINASKTNKQLINNIADFHHSVTEDKYFALEEKEKVSAAEDARNARINEAGYDPSNVKGIAGAAVDDMESTTRGEIRTPVGREIDPEDFVKLMDETIIDNSGLEIVKRKSSFATEPTYHFNSSKEAREYLSSLIDDIPSIEGQNEAKRVINELMTPDPTPDAKGKAKGNSWHLLDIAEAVKEKENALHEKINKQYNVGQMEKLRISFFGNKMVTGTFANNWWKNLKPVKSSLPLEPAGPEVKDIGTAKPLRGFKNGKPMKIDSPRETRRNPSKITADDLGITEKQKQIFDRAARKIKYLISDKETLLKQFMNDIDWNAVHGGSVEEIARAANLAYQNIETHARLVTSLKNFKNLREKFGVLETESEGNLARGAKIGNSETALSSTSKEPKADQVVSRGKIQTRAAINFDIRYSIPYSVLGTLTDEISMGSRVDKEGLHQDITVERNVRGTVMRSLELSKLRIPSADNEVKRMFKFFITFIKPSVSDDERALAFARSSLKPTSERQRIIDEARAVSDPIDIMKTNSALEQFKLNLYTTLDFHTTIGSPNALSPYLIEKISGVLEKVVPIDGKRFELKVDPTIHDFIRNSDLQTKSIFFRQMNHTHGCAI